MTTTDTCFRCGQPLKVTGSIGEVEGDSLTRFYVHEDDTPQCPAKLEPLSEEEIRTLTEHIDALDPYGDRARMLTTIAERDKTIEELEADISDAVRIGNSILRYEDTHSTTAGAAAAILEAKLEKAKVEIEYLKGSKEHYTEMRGIYMEQNVRLREALELFGRHASFCAPTGNCTCGLDDAKGEK